MNINKFINDIFTESDNITHDLVRYLAALCIIVLIILMLYDIFILNHRFDVQEFGIGVGSLFSGLGVLFRLKR